METVLAVQPPTLIAQPARHSISSFSAILLIISSATGAFMMIIPYAFFILGAILGTAVLVLGMTMTCITNRLIAKLLSRTHSYSAVDLAKEAGGRRCEGVIVTLLAISMPFIVIVQIYTSSATLQGSIVEIFNAGSNKFMMSKGFSTLLIACILSYYALKRRVAELKWVSAAVVFLFILLLLLLIIFAFLNYHPIRERNKNLSTHFHWTHALKPVSVILGKCALMLPSLATAPYSIPILQQADLTKNIIKVQNTALIIVACNYIFVMYLSLITFGELLITEDTLLKVIYKQSRSGVALLIQLIETILILCHTPLLLFSARQAILHFIVFWTSPIEPNHQPLKDDEIQEEENEQLIRRKPSKSELYTRVSPWVFYLVSIVNFIFIVIVALIIKDVTTFAQVSVSFSTIATAYVLPAFATLILLPDERRCGIVLLTISLATLSFAVFAPIYELINKH